MADTRCPICQQLNPAQAITCEFCGARLDPVTGRLRHLEPPGKDQEDKGPIGEEGLPIPEWLSNMAKGAGRAQQDDGGIVGDAEADLAVPDWLDRIRQRQQEEAQEEAAREGEQPVPPEARERLARLKPSSPGAEADDWLARLRARQAAADETRPGVEPSEPGPAGPTREEGLEEPSDRAGAGVEEQSWLGGLRQAAQPEAAPPEAPPPSGKIPEWLMEFAEVAELPEAGAREEPEWLKEIETQPAAAPEPPPEDRGRTPEPASGARFEGDYGRRTSDFLEEWERGPGGREPEPPPTKPLQEEVPAPPIGEARPERLAEGAPKPVPPRVPGEPGKAPTVRYREPDSMPSWLAELGTEAVLSSEEPKVPPLVVEGSPPPGGPRITEAFDLASVQVPDWLGELGQPGEVTEVAEPAESREPSGLAPAALPSWLEAMRPIETFRPVVEIQPEEDMTVEAAGPLAGLRGALLAEPVVAMPRGPSVSTSRLDVTERQYAQAELLHQMVEDEQRELPVLRPKAARPPFLRWAVSLAVLAGVVLPMALGIPSFPLPKATPSGEINVPLEMKPLVEIVDSRDVDRPVLIAFDYDPGYAGELEPVAGSLLEHLMLRGLKLVTISTLQAGPPLAERLMERVGASQGYEVGRDYVHLGYLSGGPTAVQLLAAGPRLLALRGFYPRGEGYAEGPVWDSPLLQGVSKLSDFGLVVVITSGTQTARVWAEQAGPLLGETPLAMVVSTAAEPLVRPYFDPPDSQVDGILTGMLAAVKYEQLLNAPGLAQSRWSIFGGGVMVAELVLVAGIIYGVALWFLTPPGSETAQP